MTVLWVAQAVTVENGNNEVIVTSAPGNAITKVETSATFHGVGFSLPYEIERTYNNGTNDVIVLYENWAGSSGSIAAVAVPSGAAVTRAADSLDALKTVYEALADSVSTTAVANGIPKYSSQGRLKAAAGSASDDVMVKSQFSDGAFGPDCSAYGLGVDFVTSETDILTVDTGSLTCAAAGTTNNPEATLAYSMLYMAGTGTSRGSRLAISNSSDVQSLRAFIDSKNGANHGWAELYHSGNTNFNEFIFASGDKKSGLARNSNELVLEFSLNNPLAPSSITVSGTFEIIDMTTNTVVATGITPELLAASSVKNGYIRLLTSSALTSGRAYSANAETGGVSIEFNF